VRPMHAREERGNGGRSARVEEKWSGFVRASGNGGVHRHGGGGAQSGKRVGGGGRDGAWICRWRCCRGGEGVVVAPEWWMGGQPPPKIKFLNFGKVGFLAIVSKTGDHGFKPPPQFLISG
jgi:hypothetical protein